MNQEYSRMKGGAVQLTEKPGNQIPDTHNRKSKFLVLIYPQNWILEYSQWTQGHTTKGLKGQASKDEVEK